MLLRALPPFIFLLLSHFTIAQDTLRITLQQADSLFLQNNFYLLASSMNIEAQKAQIIQAKLYPNPTFTAELNTYDPQNNQVFHVNQSGEKAFQLEQLIILGGKRKSEIELAKTNVKIAELEFQQLLRQLKYRLHTALFSIGQSALLLERYNRQLDLLSTLVSTYETQAGKGNIPLKDVVRLKGAYLNLNNDRAELLKDYFEAQSSLQALLQTSSIVWFRFSDSDVEKYINPAPFEAIRSEAFQNRPELLIIQTNKELAEQYYQYQRSQAKPDLNVFASYDQRGGAFVNQLNTGISISLPFWNRNQGNIKSSEFRVKEADLNLQAVQYELISQLQNSYSVYTGMTENFRKQIFPSSSSSTFSRPTMKFRQSCRGLKRSL